MVTGALPARGGKMERSDTEERGAPRVLLAARGLLASWELCVPPPTFPPFFLSNLFPSQPFSFLPCFFQPLPRL